MAKNDYKKKKYKKDAKCKKNMPKEAPENCTKICAKTYRHK